MNVGLSHRWATESFLSTRKLSARPVVLKLDLEMRHGARVTNVVLWTRLCRQGVLAADALWTESWW